MPSLEPRFTDLPALRIAGFREHFPQFDPNGIPALWQRLTPCLGAFPQQVGRAAYGVCFANQGIDYLAGVEVSDTARLPARFEHATIPPQRYAVFAHAGHVSEIHSLLERIQREWTPPPPARLSPPENGGVLFFERYGESFNPVAGRGAIEIWIPVLS